MIWYPIVSKRFAVAFDFQASSARQIGSGMIQGL